MKEYKERMIRFHSQNLNDKKGGKQGWKIVHGRAWLYFYSWVFGWEWHLWQWTPRISIGFKDYEEDLSFSFCIPPVSIWFHIRPPYGSWFHRILPERRKSEIYWYENALWIYPYAKSMEWNSKDPWYVKGKVIHFDDIILGKAKYTKEVTQPPETIYIELDGEKYKGTVEFERCTWKRPRWFAKVRESMWIEMEKGLPHAGKGENSWDCGDDAIMGYGCSGNKTGDAIAQGIKLVLENRRRYGNPSPVTHE